MYAPDRAIVVNTLQDEWNSDGDCSLREAVAAANINHPVDACPAGQVLTDTITFSVQGTITVTSQLAVTAGGPLVIDGGEVITTSGGGTTRVWMVEMGSDFTLLSLAVVDGYLNDDYGSGIYNRGTLIIADSTISNNSCGEVCSGILNDDTGILNITNSTFSGNYDPGADSIIVNWGILSIANSTISDNYGGGITNGEKGILSIANSTISGNHGSQSGGIGNGGKGILSIANSTIYDNYGGGINGSAVLTNTIVANSSYGGDCYYGAITDGGHNLELRRLLRFRPRQRLLAQHRPNPGSAARQRRPYLDACPVVGQPSH